MTKKNLSKSKSGEIHSHPDHSKGKIRINRIRGQLDGVERMIDSRRYCPDIVFQIRAATQALKSLEHEILQTHLKGCVRSAFSTKDPFEVESKVEEILNLLK